MIKQIILIVNINIHWLENLDVLKPIILVTTTIWFTFYEMLYKAFICIFNTVPYLFIESNILKMC